MLDDARSHLWNTRTAGLSAPEHTSSGKYGKKCRALFAHENARSPLQTHDPPAPQFRATIPRLTSASPLPSPRQRQDKASRRQRGALAPSQTAAADHAVLADGSLHPPVGGRAWFPQTGLFAPPVFDSCLVFCRKGYVDRGGMLTVITILRAFLWRVSMVFG